MAVLWYISFMFLVAVILLNVLLAIIVDSYMSAKEEELETWQVCGCRVQGVHTGYENTGVGCLRFKKDICIWMHSGTDIEECIYTYKNTYNYIFIYIYEYI